MFCFQLFHYVLYLLHVLLFLVLCVLLLYYWCMSFFFFFSSRRRHTRYWRDWSSDVCSSDLAALVSRRRWVADGRPADRPSSRRGRAVVAGRAARAGGTVGGKTTRTGGRLGWEIGRASCRERV